MVNRLSHRILPSIEQLAQHAADLLEHSAGRPRIFTGGLEDLFLAEARGHFTGPGSCGPPAGRRLRAPAWLAVAGGWWLVANGRWLGRSSHQRPVTSRLQRDPKGRGRDEREAR